MGPVVVQHDQRSSEDVASRHSACKNTLYAFAVAIIRVRAKTQKKAEHVEVIKVVPVYTSLHQIIQKTLRKSRQH